MAKKKRGVNISPEIEKLIKVTPEMVEEHLAKRRYTITPPPEGEKPPKNKLWCPYCAKWSKFSIRKDLNSFYKRSHCCGISIWDFYVLKYNNLWNMVK